METTSGFADTDDEAPGARQSPALAVASSARPYAANSSARSSANGE